MKKIDFIALENQIWQELPTQIGDVMVQDLYPTHEYIKALQKALYQYRYADLYQLLNNQVPVHPKLLPILSLVVQKASSKEGGRRPKLIPVQKAYIHRLLTERCLRNGLTIDKAAQELAALSENQNLLDDIDYSIDEKTIKKAFKEIDLLFDNRFTKIINRT
jgi:hypothetical protein